MVSTDEWTGRTGDVWANEWRRTDRSFTALSTRLNAAILAVAPDTGAAIDLGCGAGETAIALAAVRPGLDVVGLDLSAGLIAIARRRAAAFPNLAFRVADTAAIDPRTAANLFVSRHGVMFFADPVAAFTAIRAAGADGARLVFSCFRDSTLNPWSRLIDNSVAAASAGYAPGPFGFADPELTADILAGAGWRDATPVVVDYTYIAGAGPDPVADAVQFFSRIGPAARALAEAGSDRRADLLARLANKLAAHETAGEIQIPAAAWIWTATAGEAA